MKYLHELKEKLCTELEEIARKPEMSAGDLETVHKLTDTIKNIDKIEMLEEDEGYSQRRGYSRAGDWEARGRFGRPYDEDGSSYANRGKHYVRGHYSREDGREHMIAELEMMMKDATGHDREIIRRAMDEIRSA